MRLTYGLDELAGLPDDEARAVAGGKAAGLAAMAGRLGLPVPPAFAISTAACRSYLADGWPAGLDEEVRERIAGLEAAAGRQFGDPADPLLVSVRSGAPVSMPGMMDTILNLGLTETTTAGLAAATGSERFAGDCRARFEAQFRGVAEAAVVPGDAWQQLRLAIEAVFRSWNSARAVAYRRREGVADDLGTAVTVQAMVFGNRGPTSATGVVFTRNPATGEASLYGDVLFDAQGEDVVAGTHRTEPVAVLDERLPEVAHQLREAADRLERHGRDLCDIEFTIEEGRLWLLQVRVGKRSPQAALRIAHDMAEDPSFPLSRREALDRVTGLLANPPRTASGRSGFMLPLVTGLPASPGVASGEIATSPEAAVRAAEAGRDVVLVRSETSPDDVHGMARAVGVLTARGGLASHAAVVARGWGIPAVVGAVGLDVRNGEVAVGGRVLREGDVISVDGGSGEVFEGAIPVSSDVVPEARILLAWADELGIQVRRDAADSAAEQPSPGAGGARARRVTLDDCIRRLGTKGFGMPASLADALLCGQDDVGVLLDQLVVDGLAASVAGAYRLTEAGTARAGELLAMDRERWGTDEAAQALETFLALDVQMKETVTAWQLRPTDGGEPPINDHTDVEYDRAVLDRLAALHADASAWLAPIESACGRLAGYGERLERAVERALAGDTKYVASPRVDSYHGIWFELHEDLIRLAGRTREDEAAAGRA
ncbi:MAG TPA: pyruvate, phosphate dikinase [Candidatus Limnocylindrales bacterium]|nr:pyruvate, phosphate dikinase [Candidatus Limnocylindrales bacterium]